MVKLFKNMSGFLSFIGFYALCCYLYENLRTPAQLIRRRFLKLQGKGSLKERYGEWAIVTGACDDIGKAVARELADQGLNIVLIARTMSELENIAAKIEKEFSIQTKCIAVDFAQGRKVYQVIEKELKPIKIGILVNTVGQYLSRLDTLSSFDEDEVWSILYTNVAAVTMLSRLFLNRMEEEHIKGLIVNVSSGTELAPLPNVAIYAASKTYTTYLTLGLQEEARPFGITVQLVSPNFVASKQNLYSSYILKAGLFIPSPEQFARSLVHNMGHVDVTTGYCWHGVQTALLKMVPFRARMRVGAILSNYFKKSQEKEKLNETIVTED